jgi:hypothetical protein
MKIRPEYNLAVAGVCLSAGILDATLGAFGWMTIMAVCVVVNFACYVYTRGDK